MLRGLPLRQILIIMAKMKDRVPEQIETALNSGEGNRLILASLKDLKRELSAMIDVQQKQNEVRAVGKADMKLRLLAFQELAIASVTRTIAAIYLVSIVQLLVHTQIFALVRMQRLGRAQHEESQRRFLAIVQHLLRADDACGTSLFSMLVVRVEAAVRRFYSGVDERTVCDPARLADIIAAIRRDTELTSLSTPESWIAGLMRQLLLHASAALSANNGASGAEEEEVCMHLSALSQDMLEILDSDLFAEALEDMLKEAFAWLHSAPLKTVLAAIRNGTADEAAQEFGFSIVISAMPELVAEINRISRTAAEASVDIMPKPGSKDDSPGN